MAALLVIVALGTALVLPLYLERRLIPDLAMGIDLSPDQVQVRRVGWWGADLGPMELSQGREPVLSVAAVQLDYTPINLLRGEVTGLTLSGLEVVVQVGTGGIRVAGQQVPFSPGTSGGNGATFRLDSLLPITLKRFSIVRSHLGIYWRGQHHLLPVEVDLQTERLKAGILEGAARIRLFGNPLVLKASIDQPANRARIEVGGAQMNLSSLACCLPPTLPMEVTGKMDLDTRASFGLQPLQLSRLSMTARFEDAHLATPHGRFHTMGPGSDGGRPLELTLGGDRLDDLRWGCAPFRVDGPLELAVNALHGRLAITGRSWSLTGALDTLLPEQKLAQGGQLEAAVPISWSLTAAQEAQESGTVRFGLKSRDSGPVTISRGDGHVSCEKQRVAISGHLRSGDLVADTGVRVEGIRFASPQVRIQIPELDIAAAAQIRTYDSDRGSSLWARAVLSDLNTTSGSGELLLPKISLDLTGRAGPQRPWAFSGAITAADGRIDEAAMGLKARGLSIDLPLAWPAATAVKAGRLDLTAIRWKDLQMGGLKGILRQRDGGLDLNLRHASTLVPGMDLFVKGRIAPAGSRVLAQIPPHELGAEIDLGRFGPAAAGILATGRIGAIAELSIDETGPKASGRLKLNQGRVRQETRGLLLEGIDLAIQMEDLLQLKSAPRQRLEVGRLVLGDLVAERLKVDLQLEDTHTLFIEKAGLDWCQGRINAAALRINRGAADYRLTLYCDRLNLAQLLRQMGAAEASGRGSVNGRVPVSWVNGRLAFDNGFLYSTPGQSGTIRLTGTQALLAGLPPGSPQHTQLDIATEALKDYSYRWAKLHLQSEGEILLLKLQLDGKPNRLLPFVYDQALGQFKRVAGTGQAEFKGIGIDLNFRSPLNKIIRYRELFNPK
jgi:hypothetical protein